MSSVRLLLCGLFLVSVTSALAQDFFQSAQKPKRRGPIPKVRDVENAFAGKSEEPRANLYLKLRHAQENADRPEIVAALVKGLLKRHEQQAILGADLRLISLLGGYTDEQAEAALLTLIKSGDVRVIIVALKGLTESDRLPQWSEVLDLTHRDDYDQIFGLRRGVVAAAEREASKEAVDFLIDTVRTTDGQLKYEASRSLAALTGKGFGGQDEKWTAWWETARETFVPVVRAKQAGVSLKTNVSWKQGLPRFYELPIYARRVLFIVDRSGSMQIAGDDGVSRIDRARLELEYVIAHLPAETEFDIIAFNDTVAALSPRLLPASDDNKRNAIQFARNLSAARETNCYDALSLALDADPNLEAIYFLSDGEPTVGGIVDPVKLVDAVSLQNQLRMTTIYTLGIDARDDFERFLRKLAEKNHGEYFPIR